MNKTDTAKLLTAIAAYDRRTLGDEDVTAWQRVLEDVAYDDALAAVIVYYREHREWLMPSDVIAGVKKIRSTRMAAFTARHQADLTMLADNGDHHQFHSRYRILNRLILDGVIAPEDTPENVARAIDEDGWPVPAHDQDGAQS